MSDGIDGQSRTSRYGLWPEINGPASSTGQSVWETLRNVRVVTGIGQGCTRKYRHLTVKNKGDRKLENSPEVKC